jgi:hypothetical protein
MGTMSFLLPASLSPEAAHELLRASVAGGPDNFPLPGDVTVTDGVLAVRRATDESGFLAVPWEVAGAGRLMGSTGTLIERPQPYHFLVELGRGKVNQLRCQAADWQASGLQMPEPLAQHIRDTSHAFSLAATQPPSEQAGRKAEGALELAYGGARQLVAAYVQQMFQARHQRQPRLDSLLGCRLGATALDGPTADSLLQVCNSVCLSFAWNEVEPAEADYRWATYDALLDWAQAQGLAVTAGPLVDFAPERLPDWLWLWERDPASLANFMCDYVETVIKRYDARIRSWQLTAASNCAAVLGLGEDELLWLTARLAEVARQINPKLELYVGISQPWGEYMALEDRTHSPLIFADTLVRSGLNLAGIDVELVMAASPRGSYCRDVLDVSRLLDLYSLLGVPLRVTLGYPSGAAADSKAGPEFKVDAGYWHGGFTPEVQADWLAAVGGVALCKPVVRAVHWLHRSDAEPHLFPHCGLFDLRDQPKPAFQRLRELRENHVK